MIRGFFIFLVFICKRSVWQMTKRRHPKLVRLLCKPFSATETENAQISHNSHPTCENSKNENVKEVGSYLLKRRLPNFIETSVWKSNDLYKTIPFCKSIMIIDWKREINQNKMCRYIFKIWKEILLFLWNNKKRQFYNSLKFFMIEF